MLNYFEKDKYYRLKTWDELIKMPGVECIGVEEDDYNKALDAEQGESYYIKEMDFIENRTVRGNDSCDWVYQGDNEDDVYLIEPWMCEETTYRFIKGKRYRVKSLSELKATEGVEFNSNGDLQYKDGSEFRLQYMSKYCGTVFTSTDSEIEVKGYWLIHPWMCEELSDGFEEGKKYKVKSLSELIATEGVTFNADGDLEYEDGSEFRIQYMNKYCGTIFTSTGNDTELIGQWNWNIHPWMCEAVKEQGKNSDKIKVKYFGNVEKLKKLYVGDWIDLRFREAEILENKLGLKDLSSSNEFTRTLLRDDSTTYYYNAGDVIKMKLGVAMQLPEGYEAVVVPRSSVFKNYGLILVNSIGVIDNSYNGDDDEWGAIFYATRSGSINTNDRICQFRLQKNMQNFEIEEVEVLGNKSRGGFGSTGK